MAKTYLNTNDLYLRACEPEDVDVMYLIENDTELWEVGVTNVPYSRYALKEFIAGSVNDIYVDRQLRMMIIRKEDKQVLGIVDIYDFDSLHSRAALGIVILKEYRKAGYARQAINMLCDYCLNYLSLHQLYAYIPADNEASRMLFTSCGFEQAGVLKDWLRAGGRYKDVFLFQHLGKCEDLV